MIPGQVVRTFTTKAGDEAVIRYPRWEDLDALLRFVNRMSQEDTYVLFSGQEVSREDEAAWLAGRFRAVETGNSVYLNCWVNGHLAAGSGIDRNTAEMTRGCHVANFGIVVDQAYRGQGVGKALTQTIIDEARRVIAGLRVIELSVFGNNPVAQTLYRQVGFVEYGRLPGGFLHRGEYVDKVLMCLDCTQ